MLFLMNMPELKIIKSDAKQDFTAYDIEVEDNHNYFANGLVFLVIVELINLDGTFKSIVL